MSRSKGRKPIRFPEIEKREAVSIDLGLGQEQHDFLWGHVSRIVQTISAHHDARQTGDLLSDKDRKTWLKSTIAEFERLQRQLTARRSTTTEAILESTLLPVLGELIGHHGLEVLSQGQSHFSLEPHEIGERELQDRTVDLASIDRQAEHLRIDAVTRDGSMILSNLLARLSLPLRQRLALEQADPGGSPGRLHRNYTIQELVPVYAAVYGERPRSGPGSKFLKLCWHVLISVGIEADGLEDAVERLLKKRRKSAAKKRSAQPE